MIVIGVDPGVTGAIAVHSAGSLDLVMDMPVLGGRTDGGALADILGAYHHDEVAIYLEDTHAMPKNGSIASYSLGFNSGVIVGVVQSLSHPLHRVRPAIWKRKMGVTTMDKNAIRGLVREIYPAHAKDFERVKDHNRAEAVLISRYGVASQLMEANAR